jgi:hypothetical protein
MVAISTVILIVILIVFKVDIIMWIGLFVIYSVIMIKLVIKNDFFNNILKKFK